MVKETGKFDRERRVQSTRFAHFWLVPKGDIGCLLALAGRYKPPTGFCHELYEITMEPQSKASHLFHAWHVIHSHKHTVELVSSGQFSSVAQSCLTLCDSVNRSTPNLPVHHHLPEFTQMHVHGVRDAIQPSHPLSSPSPPAPSPSQHQSLFQ